MEVRCIILGASGVGKTALVNTTRPEVEKRYQSTIGVDYAVYRKNNPSVTLHIWDTSGSKRFDYVVDVFLKKVDIIVFVYKCSGSFTYLIKKLKEVKKKGVGKRFCIVSFSDPHLGRALARKYGYLFVHITSEQQKLQVFNMIATFCYEENKRCNFLVPKVPYPKERDSGYCWFSIC
jgi:hypothetical protein